MIVIALAGLTSSSRYAIFALPMIATLVLGLIYLGYSMIECDPLYTNDPAVAGYKSGSVVAALTPLVPTGYPGDKRIPLPIWSFGACLTP